MWSQSFGERLGWPFVLFTAHSFPERLVMIYLTCGSFTFLCRDQSFERLKISDNWEALTEHRKLCCPFQLPPSPGHSGFGHPEGASMEWGCLREQVGPAHTSQQWPDLPCELPGNGISAWELQEQQGQYKGCGRPDVQSESQAGPPGSQPPPPLFSSHSLKPV
jgi:hypothetical protein